MRTAVYAGTRNVYGEMVGAAKSLIHFNGADQVIFLTEDDAFPYELPDMISTINVTRQEYFKTDGPNFANHWTWMVLLRVALPLMLTGRVLSLDIDTVVHGDLTGLWNLPPGPLYMAREVGRTEEYYNAGVMLMDCEDLRQDAKEIIRVLNCRKLTFPDQDAINEVMRGRIKTLPPQYNDSNWTIKGNEDPVITHYAAIRQWTREPLWQKYAGRSWGEVLESPHINAEK